MGKKKRSSMMLGAVKMEGHEHTDWSSYYGEPEVGTLNIYFSLSLPPSKADPILYNSILALR